MNLPERPLSSNLTMPSTSAKSVSSLPRPTFLPGFHFVPRWRARMFPPSTRSPPNFFNPSRCAFESRPLRDDPTPFLCAISDYLVTSDGRQVTGQKLFSCHPSLVACHGSFTQSNLSSKSCSPGGGPACAC